MLLRCPAAMPRSPQGDSHSAEWPESKRGFNDWALKNQLVKETKTPMIRKTVSLILIKTCRNQRCQALSTT